MLDALIAEARIRWGLDPSAGLQVVVPERLAAFPIEPSRPLLVVPAAVFRVAAGPGDRAVEQLPGRHAAQDARPGQVLARLYPAGHAVGRIGLAEAITVGDLTPESFAGALYLPPASPDEATASPWSLPWIAHRLRRPDGCPWDREQTHLSLKKHLLEEAYEVYDALSDPATPELAGELGDLLLQIVLHAQLAAEEGAFDLTDVQAEIGRKIVRRHPHVFADAQAATPGDVNRQWEQIKRAEREAAAAGDETAQAGSAEKSALDGICPLHARPGRSPGDAGARRQSGLRLAGHRRHHGQGPGGAGRAGRSRHARRAARGGRRSAARGDEPGPPPRRRCGVRAASRLGQVPGPLPPGGADGPRAAGPAARSGAGRTGRLVGCCQGRGASHPPDEETAP